ncbi:MAG: hypothetical protein R3D33_00990 [Hyphomicrobiaceae bacterium]
MRALAIGLLLLAVAGGAAEAQTPEVRIGEATIKLVTPAGHCVMDAANPADARYIQIVNGLLEQSGNTFLGATADCKQLEVWRNSTDVVLDDSFQFQTRAQFANQDLSAMRSEVISAACATVRSQGEQILAEAGAVAAERIQKLMEGARQDEVRFLGVLEENKDGCYAAMLQKMRTEIGTEKVQIGTIGITIVKGKVLYVALYSPYVDEAKIKTQYQQTRTAVEAILAANAQ